MSNQPMPPSQPRWNENQFIGPAAGAAAPPPVPVLPLGYTMPGAVRPAVGRPVSITVIALIGIMIATLGLVANWFFLDSAQRLYHASLPPPAPVAAPAPPPPPAAPPP